MNDLQTPEPLTEAQIELLARVYRYILSDSFGVSPEPEDA